MNPKEQQEATRKLLNKYVIVGLTYMKKQQNQDQEHTLQLHGRIVRINQSEGIVVRREDKQEEYHLPLDFSAFIAAEPGEYRLVSTGEVVVNPDYVSSWTI